jgi:hypothetical protein
MKVAHLALLAFALTSNPGVPQQVPHQPLLRVQGEWVSPPPEIDNPIRSAPATLVLFRANGEYVEHHFWAIEQQDKEVSMSAGDPHVVVVGTWRQAGSRILATRKRIARTVRVIGGADPLCKEPIATFFIKGSGVSGKVGAQVEGMYLPNAKLRLPTDFEVYTEEARAASSRCGA